jgi:hypothetical protein
MADILTKQMGPIARVSLEHTECDNAYIRTSFT